MGDAYADVWLMQAPLRAEVNRSPMNVKAIARRAGVSTATVRRFKAGAAVQPRVEEAIRAVMRGDR